MDFTNVDEVLELTLKLWKKLAISGSSTKHKPLKKLGVYSQMTTQCPLCEYGNVVSKLNGTTKCNECRQIFTWNSETNHCTDPESYYQKWEDAIEKSEKHYWANKMLELILYNIRKHQGMEKVKLQ